MSTIPFEEFLAKFSEIKAKVNSNSNNLGWRAKNDSALGFLAWALHSHYRQIALGIAKSERRVVTPPTATFRQSYGEYVDHWATPVENAARHWWGENREVIFESLKSIPGAADKLSGPPDFDPTSEKPSELIDSIFWWAGTIADNYEGTDTGDDLHKAFQAWDYVRRSIGVDLDQICHRWSKTHPVFVPPHVAKAYGTKEIGRLYHLLDEAYRAYVYGAYGAAIAMCRAITETVLKKHYGIEDEKLKDIIFLAERRYPWVGPLKLQQKRDTANRMLHEEATINEEDVLSFLTAVKELIERAPKS